MNRLFSRFPAVETILWVAASIIAFIAFLIFAPGFFSASAGTNTPTPKVVVQVPPTLTPAPLATPLPPFAPAPKAQIVVPVPQPGPKAQVYTFSADPSNSAWIRTGETQPHWADRNLNVGLFKGQNYQGLLYFDLSTLAPGTKITFADVQIAGLDRERLGPIGTWQLNMFKSDINANWSKLSSQEFAKAPVATSIGKMVQPEELAAGVINQFIFTPEQIAILEEAVNNRGIVTFRLDGPAGTRDSLFTWDAGGLDAKTGIRPTLHVLGIPGTFVSVTNTPTPQNIITAAANAQTLQAQAVKNGTATPFPRNYATATPYILITPEPTAMNQQTVVAQNALATAVAVTTGTYTPTPANWATAYPSPTPVFIPLGTLTPFVTATPLPGPLQAVQTPLPNDIRGNIIFLSDHFGNRLPLLMKPDGTLLQALSGLDIYNTAHARDILNPERTKQLVLQNDPASQLQVYIQDLGNGSLQQVSFVKSGNNFLAYDPAWSPDGTKIAYVSTQPGPTEIFIYDLKTRSTRQITSSPAAVYNQRPSWSPDSQQLVFKSNLNGRFQIWMINADGSDLHNVSNSPYNDTDPVWAK